MAKRPTIRITLFSALTSLSFLFLTACSKQDHNEVDNEIQTTVDEAMASEEFSNLGVLVLYHLSNTSAIGPFSGLTSGVSPFALSSGDATDVNAAKTYSLDASLLGGNLGDSKKRTGQIFVLLKGNLSPSGQTLEITIKNYVSDKVEFNCKKGVLNLLNESGNYLSVDWTLNGGSIVENGKTMTFNSQNRIAIFYKGGGFGETPYYTMYGNASGVASSGIPYNSEIVKDVLRFHNCSFFTAGELKVQPQGFKEKLVNYGDGTCDNLANYTVGENKVAFKLK